MHRTFAALARPVAALALLAIGVAHLRYHSGYTLDDAYITFRYARNLVRGVGLVYNPGDYVKGYSNTLFTLLMALPEWLRHDPIGFSRAIGLVSFAALFALSYCSHVRPAAAPARLDRSHWLLALLAASSAIAVHFSGGLETGSYTVLVFAAVLRRVHEQTSPSRPWSALLFSLVIWSRPEGILIFGACALHDLGWRAWTRRFRLADLVFFLVPPLAYAGELAASLAYYGAAFPQTYYAKSHETAGVLDAARTLWSGFRAQLAPDSYLSRGLSETGFGWLGLIGTPLALIDPATRRRNAALLLALFAELVFVIRAGDDWAPAFRFGVPLLPLWFALLVDAVAGIAMQARRYERLAFNALGAILLALCLPAQLRQSQQVALERPVNAENKLAEGRWFATLADPGITLASFDIGGQGYAAGGFEILDSVGLTVRETTGCRDRMSSRCMRYAQLALPELVRLHNNRKRDAFVSRSVAAVQPYLVLDGGKYLIARTPVFPDQFPPETQTHEPVASGDAYFVGHDLPRAIRAGRSMQIHLYWHNVGTGYALIGARKLRWHAADGGDRSAGASESILPHLAAPQAVKNNALFADPVRIEAPSKPGRYALQLVVGDSALELGSVDCLEGPATIETAKRWLAEAHDLQADDRIAALRVRERAAELSDGAIDDYQQATVELAMSWRIEAERHVDAEPVPALRLAQRAKRELIRTFWTSGYAGTALRREIDANGALRRRIITSELSSLR